MLVASGIIFGIAEFFADSWFGLIANSECFKYLGCNVGFFGYDAIIHFLGGAFEVLLVIWLCQKFPRWNILHEDSIWKDIVVLIAAVALLAVGWELWEFSVDHFRMDILHENIAYPNHMAQPSNSDTMGDFTFGLTGALIGALLVKSLDPRSIRKKKQDE